MPGIKIDGVDELRKKLKENVTMNMVKTVVEDNGKELRRRMKAKAEFRGHMGYRGGVYTFIEPTGTTKGTIEKDPLTDGGLTVTVHPTTEYSPYLEYGTRFMDAQSFVRPALDEQKRQFKKDMDKLVR